jgi:hypothetical protein
MLRYVKILLLVLTLAVTASCYAHAVEDKPAAESNRSDAQGKNCYALFQADAVGHTWENAYLLALACHYNYHEKLGVVPFEDFEQFQKKYRELFTPWGIDTCEFIRSDGPIFDTELIVMSKSDGDFVIVVFRGSEHIGGPVSAAKDAIFTDGDIRFEDVSAYLGDGVRVHAGFWHAFTPVTEKIIRAIEKQGGFSEGRKLWLTGNSLGAALANLCALSLRQEGYRVQGVCTFGAPRCGDERFRQRYEDDFSILCYRWVNDNDIVPMLPPLEDYRHVGVLAALKSDGSVVFNDSDYDGMGNPLKHYQEFYAYRIYQLLPPELKAKMPPPPPLPPLAKPFL